MKIIFLYSETAQDLSLYRTTPKSKDTVRWSLEIHPFNPFQEFDGILLCGRTSCVRVFWICITVWDVSRIPYQYKAICLAAVYLWVWYSTIDCRLPAWPCSTYSSLNANASASPSACLLFKGFKGFIV